MNRSNRASSSGRPCTWTACLRPRRKQVRRGSSWWLDRIENEDLSPGSANKDLIHLGDVLKTVNKFLRENGLMETPKHKLYGLRHSFEDRMLAAGVGERIRRDLMGHALDRERYGKGASLEHLQGLIQATAL